MLDPDGGALLGAIAEQVRTPSAALLQQLATTAGDIAVVGAAGKMGVSLSRMASDALAQLPGDRRVTAISRFSDPELRRELDDAGVTTVAADVSDTGALRRLPDFENVIYLVGRKFGTTTDSSATWFTNAVIPSLVLDRYRTSRVVALSSGNVYPFTSPVLGGATEASGYGPIGDYAQSCVAREQVIVHRSLTSGTPVTLVRLNYAIDCRYGVLTDIARAVRDRTPIDVSQGAVNVVWQGDANRYCLSALTIAESPPRVLNVTGPETVSVRWVAEVFGRMLGVEPELVGEESATALLSNASECHRLFGYPEVTLATMIEWTAAWLEQGGPLLGKPTGFGTRDGKF